MQSSCDDNDGDAPAGAGPAMDFETALVVASSPVNGVVVSRICERVGLRTVCMTPEHAQTALPDPLPVLVILDGGADNRECSAVTERLAQLRRPVADRLAPLVILLCSHNDAALPPVEDDVVDMTMAKPILPDRLQPVLCEMIDGLRRS